MYTNLRKYMSVVLVILLLTIATILLCNISNENVAHAAGGAGQASTVTFPDAQAGGSLTILGEDFVYADETYTYTVTGEGFIMVDISGNPDIVVDQGQSSAGEIVTNVTVLPEAMPYSSFVVSATRVDSQENTMMIVTIMPVYATDIGEVAVKVRGDDASDAELVVNPGDILDVGIKSFVVDEQEYRLENSVSYSDFAIVIITTDYASAWEYNTAIIVNNVFSVDNPVIVFNVVVIQPRAPEEYRRIVKEVQQPVKIPVGSISIEGAGGEKDRGNTYSFAVKYNDNNVASNKRYETAVTYTGLSGDDASNYYSVTADTENGIFTVKIDDRAPYGSGITVKITSSDNEQAVAEISLASKLLESKYTLEYSQDYNGDADYGSGIQLIEIGNKTQLRAGYKADIYLVGGTTGTRYTPSELQAKGVDISIISKSPNQLRIIQHKTINIVYDAPAHTSNSRTVYNYTVSISDGTKSYGTTEKKVEVYRALGGSTGGTIELAYGGDSTGLDITAARNKITFKPQGNNFTARNSTDFEFSVNASDSKYLSVVVSGNNTYLDLIDYAVGSLADTYTITVTNAVKYNNENVDAAWKQTVSLNRRFVSSFLHLLLLANKPSDHAYYMICDIDTMMGNWPPISKFSGTLDGRYHTINNLTINKSSISSSAAYGLFGDLTDTAVIKNMQLKNVKIYFGADHSTVQCNVGAVAGSNYGLIENVDVYGTLEVNRISSFSGGIVGKNYAPNGTIKNCKSYMWMFCSGDMGGIAGQNYAGTLTNGKGIINCNMYSDYYHYIEGNHNRSVGGIVGYNKGGAVAGCNNYGMFYFGNRDTGRGSAENDYRCIPKDKDLHPHIGGIIGHNDSAYFDNTGLKGGHGGFTYSTIVGYDQLKYFYANYDGRVGRNGA